jgi:hypothetical protein
MTDQIPDAGALRAACQTETTRAIPRFELQRA